jgi:ubiquinone/menaquinone biosynthesis C-methylase UbiE
MNKKTWILSGLTVGAAAGVGYVLWKRAQRAVQVPAAMPTDQAHRLLERAAPLLRLPTSPDRPPKVLSDGSGLRCPATGEIYYPYRGGVLDLLGDSLEKTFTQHTLDTSFTAWAYDRFRGWITRALNVPDFPEEVARIQQMLQAQVGDTVLDLACGQGNFTVEWAKRVGPTGLVIGLDISRALLTRAAYHVNRWGLDNVLLIRGDAHQLPFADECLHKVNCSGGFHQFPDLPQALREIRRVSAPTCRRHCVRLDVSAPRKLCLLPAPLPKGRTTRTRASSGG